MSVNVHRREPINTRELAALRMVWASAAWMAVEILRKLWGDAAGGAGEACLAQVWRASRRRMGAHGHERGCKGASPGSPRCSGSPRCF